MTSYVVLQVPDDDPLLEDNRVLGIFEKPTRFCKGCLTKNKKSAYYRDSRTGWWCCSYCRRTILLPKEKLFRHIISQAVNLLPTWDKTVSSVLDEGWGPSGRS